MLYDKGQFCQNGKHLRSLADIFYVVISSGDEVSFANKQDADDSNAHLYPKFATEFSSGYFNYNYGDGTVTASDFICLKKRRCTFLQKQQNTVEHCDENTVLADKIQHSFSSSEKDYPTYAISRCDELPSFYNDDTINPCTLPASYFEYPDVYYALCYSDCKGQESAPWAVDKELPPCTQPDPPYCAMYSSTIASRCADHNTQLLCPVLCHQCLMRYTGNYFNDSNPNTAIPITAPGVDCVELMQDIMDKDEDVSIDTTAVVASACSKFQTGDFPMSQMNISAFFNACHEACNIASWSSDQRTVITCMKADNTVDSGPLSWWDNYEDDCTEVDFYYPNNCLPGEVDAAAFGGGHAVTYASMIPECETTTTTTSTSTTTTTTTSTSTTTVTISTVAADKYYQIRHTLTSSSSPAEIHAKHLQFVKALVGDGVPVRVVVSLISSAAPDPGYRRRREEAYNVDTYLAGTTPADAVAVVQALTSVGDETFDGPGTLAAADSTPAATTTTAAATTAAQPATVLRAETTEKSGYIGEVPEALFWTMMAIVALVFLSFVFTIVRHWRNNYELLPSS